MLIDRGALELSRIYLSMRSLEKARQSQSAQHGQQPNPLAWEENPKNKGSSVQPKHASVQLPASAALAFASADPP